MENFKPVRDKFVYRDVPEGESVKVEIYYTKGGINYFSGGTNRRGIYLSVRKTKLEKTTFGTTESFDMFGSKDEVKFLVAELRRKSDNKIAAVAEHFDKFVKEYVEAWKADPAKANADMLARVKEFRGEAVAA